MKTNTVTVSAGLIPKVAPAVAPLPLNAVPPVYLFNLNHLLVSTDIHVLMCPISLNAVPPVYLFNLNYLLVSTDMYYNVSYL